MKKKKKHDKKKHDKKKHKRNKKHHGEWAGQSADERSCANMREIACGMAYSLSEWT